MATHTIGKRFTFDAAHRVDGLPDGHKCARIHGHTYVVELELAVDRLDDVGFVRDFGDLRPIQLWIDATLDHRNLNDVIPVNPTAENLAVYIFRSCADNYPEMVAVKVWETPTSWAEYRP